ncbi:MAG: pilin accessory family protein [Rhodospirillales bacterium]|nr:pilin accessory family protein [Rhodospirillales bacterium]
MARQREDGPHVLTLDGRSWALGLAWQVVTTPGVNLRKRALQDAREAIDTDLFCVPQTLTPCFGLGARGQGHRPGMPAAAASLARSMPGHWVGAFELPGKVDRRDGAPLFWLVAVRQEGIDPRTDIVGREAEIQALFRQRITDGSPRWYAPRAWQIGGSSLDLASQLARGPRLRLMPTTLLPRFERRTWIHVAACVAAIAVVVAGLLDRRERIREAEAQARRAAREVAPAARRPEIMLPPDEPWNREASATRWAASCIDAMRDAVVAVPGWRWVEATCDGVRASASYARQDGSLALAKSWWTRRPPTRASLRAARADFLTIDVPMRGLVPRATEHPSTREALAASLLDPLDAARLAATTTEMPATEPPPRDTGSGPIVRRPPGAPSVQIALTGVLLPLDDVAAALARLPAATLREATLRNAGAVPAWSATALIYLKQ